MEQKNNSIPSAGTKDDSSTKADVTTSAPIMPNPMLPAVALLECCNCGNKIEEYYYKEKDNEIYCDNCYQDNFQFTCSICEEYHDNPETPQENYIYLHKEIDGYKQGFYNVLRFPVYFSDMFSATICSDALNLASTNRIYKENTEDPTGFICKGCFDNKGVSQHSIYSHIRSKWISGMSKKKIDTISKIIVNVSPEYYECMKGKGWHKKMKLVKDKTKKVQQISFRYEFKEVSTS